MPAEVYRHLGLILIQVTMFDKIKNSFFPYDVSLYRGLDYSWRIIA